jgi:EAL domain-containing protein (putative c-di-GMP-specific phosphodiesterase class I)
LKFLQLLRCDEWQGYLYSKPVTSEKFRELLLKNNELKAGPSGAERL